jgi:plastocyanin
MFFAPLSLGLVLLPLVSAQTIHDVQVGGSSLTFTPEAIFANPGDQVVFHFQQKNHTATQSSFASPCGHKDGGFDSGFMPVAANVTSDFPTWTITVNDTQPIWVFCDQAANLPASHCGAGMVFAVNCGADGSPNSFTNFKNAALGIGASLSAAAASASATPPSGVATAAYGGVTIPPAPTPSLVTADITMASSTWTTVYSSYPNSPAPTPAAAGGNIITVVVGGPGKLLFDPAHVVAQPMDTIVFEFQQKNHSVVQSSFADPCRKLDNNGVPGFISDFFPVGQNDTVFPTWNMTVNDTAPIWAYCRQQSPTSHCGAGMVFAVNSDESSPRNFTAFKSLAEQLNGTALAATASSSTAPAAKTGAAAPSMRVGGIAGLTAVLGAVLVSLL